MPRSKADWQPACPFSALQARAELLARIRRFFAERLVLEVETPLLCLASGTDPNLQPFTSQFHQPGQALGLQLYLQTSPEFCMKRLLAAGSGSIYQICKAFRNEETGRHHNPEFSILEWYRLGFGLSELMDEVDDLLALVFAGKAVLPRAERISYCALFERELGLNPLTASLEDLNHCAHLHGMPEAQSLCGLDCTLWLDLLFSHLIQPKLALDRPCFVYEYPAFMPSLARPKPDNPAVVERVEVFYRGMELGNGYHELADATEQARRFASDLSQRQAQSLPLPQIDERLLAALDAGLPDCAGIAIGLDRLLMLITEQNRIDEVLAFPLARA